MNRNDMIDVLTAVAAGDRRTVGEADVTFWCAVITEDTRVTKDEALHAIVEHFRERPGVWLEPGHIVERVRAARRDRLERESDEMRERRQDSLAVKAAEDFEALAERKGIPTGRQFLRKSITGVNPLTVNCPWCHASAATRCTIPGTRVELEEHPPMRSGFHPSRIEAAEKAKANV